MKAKVFVVLAAVLGGSAPAWSTPPPDPDNASISVYIETIPTVVGSQALGTAKETKTPLPPDTRRTIIGQGGADAETLEAIATSSALGAPGRPASERASRVPSLRSQGLARELPAAVDRIPGGIDGLRLALLAAFMIATGIWAVSASRRQPGSRREFPR